MVNGCGHHSSCHKIPVARRLGTEIAAVLLVNHQARDLSKSLWTGDADSKAIVYVREGALGLNFSMVTKILCQSQAKEFVLEGSVVVER